MYKYEAYIMRRSSRTRLPSDSMLYSLSAAGLLASYVQETDKKLTFWLTRGCLCRFIGCQRCVSTLDTTPHTLALPERNLATGPYQMFWVLHTLAVNVTLFH